MADIAAHFEAPHHRAVAHLTVELRRLAARLAGSGRKPKMTSTQLELDARQLADAGLPSRRGFERTVASMLRCGLR